MIESDPRLPAERIRTLRQSLGMTQVEFAAAVGVAEMTVHRWEHGKSKPGAVKWSHILRLEPPTPASPVGLSDKIEYAPPHPMTDLIGRRDDVAAINGAIGVSRLVTLIGPGGVGKTRLALEVTRTIAHGPNPQPVRWLDLASLVDGHMISEVVARAVGCTITNDGALVDQVIRLIGTQPIVLVFDNCEQIVERCGALIAALLSGCRSVRVLATSRIALNVPGEQRWPVSPLRLPRGDGQATEQDILSSEAGNLFVERARLVRPAFSLTADNARLIADICHRLDGLPLALELAAARISSLSPAEIAVRLDNRFSLLRAETPFIAPRHRAIQATLEWSYDLLAPVDRTHFARLGVSAGAFDLPTARALLDDLTEEQTIAALDRLVAQSLLTVGDLNGPVTRYRLLETVRAYAVERLTEFGDADAVHQRHADHFAALALRSSPELDGPDQVAWFAGIDADRANLLAALTWFVEIGDFEAELQMANALWRYWWVRGLHSEGHRWLTAGLTNGTTHSPDVRALALTAIGVFALDRADWVSAHSSFTEGLTLWRQGSDREGLRFGLIGFALWGMAVGDLDSAEAAYLEALAICRELGDDKQVALRTFNLASVALARNDLERVEALLATIVPRFREYNHRFGIANATVLTASVAARRNDLTRANHLLTQALSLFEELDYPDGIAMVNDSLGDIHRRRGDRMAAARCFRRALLLWRTHVGRHRVAHLLRSVAVLAMDRDRLIQAVKFAAAAETLCPGASYAHLQWIPGWFDSRLNEIRATLGDERFTTAWSEGTLLSVDEVVALITDDQLDAAETGRPRGALSPRGRDILRLIAAGRTNAEIASLLGISNRTVEHHLTTAYAILGARGRADAVARALSAGLLTEVSHEDAPSPSRVRAPSTGKTRRDRVATTFPAIRPVEQGA